MPHPIVIIGDGYAAAVLLVHLARRHIDMNTVTVIGGAPLGHGAAYGTVNPHFRLNVRDDLMVIDQDQPDDFVNWAKQCQDADAIADNGAGHFYRRGDFARYLAAVLDQHDIKRQITQIAAKAIDITRENNDLWVITLDNDITISAQHVILATGNPPPSAASMIAEDIRPDIVAKHIISTPWKGDAIDHIPPLAHVGCIGGGLTALDACLALYENGHKGRITLMTPRGILPPPQSAWQDMDIPGFPDYVTASGFLRHMRRYLPDSDWTEPAWQSACEALRVQIADGWRQLCEHDRMRLMRRLGWLWSLIRYRASPQSITAVNHMRSTGQLHIVADRVRQIASGETDHPLLLHLATHDDIACDYAVIAAGIGHDPLMARLIKTQIAATMANGIRVNDDFQLIAPNGHPQHRLWVIGPPTQSALGDVIGATTIAKQAAGLADQLAAICLS